MGVEPWELAKQPVAWKNWALTAMEAEAEAESERLKQAHGQRGR